MLTNFGITTSSKIPVTSPDQVEALLSFIQPLVKDVVEDGGAEGEAEAEDDEDFEAGQLLVASLIHRIASQDPVELYQMYVVARKHFGQVCMPNEPCTICNIALWDAQRDLLILDTQGR